MIEQQPHTPESHEAEPNFTEKVNELLTAALGKTQENPSRKALAGLFLLASTSEAVADDSENVQSFLTPTTIHSLNRFIPLN